MSAAATNVYNDNETDSSELSDITDGSGDDDEYGTALLLAGGSEEDSSESSDNGVENQDDWPGEGTYYPSQDEIIETRNLLHTLIPMELVSLVMDAANYGQCHVDYNWRATSIPVRYTIVPGQQLDALPWQFLVTAPIGFYSGNIVAENVKVKKVVFWMRSRAHQDSKVWFEASIYRRMQYSGRGSKVEALRRIVESRTSAPDIEDLKAARIELVRNESSDEYIWHIQSNHQPTDEMVDRKVEWTANNEVFLDDKANGRGPGTGFVSTLRAGDRIAVIARTEGQTWEDRVARVSVEVFFTTQ